MSSARITQLFAAFVWFVSAEEAFGRSKEKRAESLSVAVDGGIGWATLQQFHRGVDQFAARVRQSNPNATLGATTKSNLFGEVGFSVQYRFPRYIYLEATYSWLYNQATTDFASASSRGAFRTRSMAMELSLQVGAYFPWTESWAGFVSFGPSALALIRSYWDYSLGDLNSFRAARGGGIRGSVGAEYRLLSWLSLEFQARWRFLRTSRLEPSGSAALPDEEIKELDFSGIGFIAAARCWLF